MRVQRPCVGVCCAWCVSTKSFFVHHMQQLGRAASIGDAHAINEQAIKLRASLHGSATAHATATHASGARP